jgi:hypothetical protein
LNIRSLKKIGSSNAKACDLLAQDCNAYNIDVCMVVETFLSSRVPDTYIWMEGYSVFRRDRKICFCRAVQCDKLHGGGGIMAYVRTSIQCEIFNVSDETESMWLKLRTNDNNILFLNLLYVPPSSKKSYTDELTRYITQSVDDIQKRFPKAILYIAGDFNRMCLEDIEFACGVTMLPSPPTRGDAHLDVVLTSRPDLVDKVDCFTPRVETDHRAVLVSPIKKSLPDRYTHEFRLFSAAGHLRLFSSLRSTDFSDIYCSDVDYAAEILENTILRIMQESFPLRRVQMSSKDPVWVSPKTKWLLLKKKQAKRRRRSHTVERIDHQLQDAKIRALAKCGSKQWWNKMDNINHRKKCQKSIDMHAFQPEELNLKLAQRSNIPENEPRRPAPYFNTTKTVSPQISLQEVNDALKSCKRTSRGPSDIPDFVFREHWEVLAPLYLYVWNLSLSQGTFPQCYKRADIYPLPKVKNAKEVQQIRGISITSISARLFERIVHRKWISRNICMRGDPMQFAYKRGMSTSDYLLFLQFFTLSQLDREHVDGVHVVAVDFEKAFDCVDQELAAEEYHKFTDYPFIAKWLYNFTVDRKQRLIWRNTRCAFHPIHRGCSQGTVGGPAIFSMLTDDCVSSRPQCKVIKYSDDMSCVVPCLMNPGDADNIVLKAEFDNFRQWSSRKNLKINIEKTKQIRFSLNPSPVCLCSCDPIDISCVSDIKILGITFQRNCLFSKHVKNLLSHVRSLLYLLKDLYLHCIPLHEINRVFEAVIISRITYGISVYGCDKKALKKIDTFLEKCYLKRYSCKKFDIYVILEREDKRLLENVLKNTAHPLRPYLLSRRKLRSTRHNFFGVKPRTRTKLFLQSFCNRVLTI